MEAERPIRGARFVYISDGARPPRIDGAAHRRRYAWWLLAGNNRPIGRTARTTESLDAARAAAAAVHQAGSALDAVVSSEVTGRQWRWVAMLGGERVAVCMHRYARRAECLRALEGFLATLSDADPGTGAVWPLGARALRGVDDAPEVLALPAAAVPGRHA